MHQIFIIEPRLDLGIVFICILLNSLYYKNVLPVVSFFFIYKKIENDVAAYFRFCFFLFLNLLLQLYTHDVLVLRNIFCTK